MTKRLTRGPHANDLARKAWSSLILFLFQFGSGVSGEQCLLLGGSSRKRLQQNNCRSLQCCWCTRFDVVNLHHTQFENYMATMVDDWWYMIASCQNSGPQNSQPHMFAQLARNRCAQRQKVQLICDLLIALHLNRIQLKLNSVWICLPPLLSTLPIARI